MKDGVPKTWPNVCLGEVCNFENGDRGKNYPGRKALVPIGIPFINAGHIADGVIDWDGMDFIPKDKFDLLGAGKIRRGDILYCLRGSLGKFGIVDRPQPGAIASSLVIVRPTERIDVNFLAYFFRSPLSDEMVERFAGGAAQPNLSAKSLSQYVLPLPPLEEQQQIVAVLDEAFEGLDRARENAEVNLKNARELFGAFLKASLSEMTKKYGEVALDAHCDFRNGFAFKSSKFKPAGMPIVRISNIHEDGMKLERLVHTDPADYSEDLSRYEVQPGELLIAMSGATTGKLGFNNTTEVYLQNQRVGRFCETSTLRLQFLSFYLSTKIEENLAISAGAAQPNLSTKQIREIKLPVPPIAIQDEFVAKLTSEKVQATSLQSHYQTKLQDLDDLRQSLLQKAFAGELT